ncbi:MAG: hypothetical protein KF773_14715 [Deltaproteobacteria bacterium]|nr:hypothetical protein [Deltaproteobacteria bacterium]
MSSRGWSPLVAVLSLLTLAACGDDDVTPTQCRPGDHTTTVALHTRQRSQLLDVRAADAGLVALRDGDDPSCPWQVQAGSGTGAYELAITHERYAVAVACTDPSVNPVVRVFSRTVQDVAELTATCAARVDDTGAHAIGIEFDTSETPATFEGFLLDQTTERQLSAGAFTQITWQGRGGTYDLVVFGRTNLAAGAPDELLVIRDVLLDRDRIVDAHPATAAYVPFAPAGTMSAPEPLTLQTRYLTGRGTRAPLGIAFATDGATAGTFATWPAALVDPGDAYEQIAFTADATSSRLAQRFTLDPSNFTPALPPAFDPAASLTLGGDAPKLAHAALADAALYSLNCIASDHAVVYDVSATYHGPAASVVFPLPALPDELPAATRSFNGCTWEIVAAGSTHGLATELELANIGLIPGTPAQLAGTERWLSRRDLTAR